MPLSKAARWAAMVSSSLMLGPAGFAGLPAAEDNGADLNFGASELSKLHKRSSFRRKIGSGCYAHFMRKMNVNISLTPKLTFATRRTRRVASGAEAYYAAGLLGGGGQLLELSPIRGISIILVQNMKRAHK